MEQLLLLTSCDSPAGIGASLRTHNGRTNGRTDGWTHRRDVGNSILDISLKFDQTQPIVYSSEIKKDKNFASFDSM